GSLQRMVRRIVNHRASLLRALEQYVSVVCVFLGAKSFWPVSIHSDAQLQRIAFQFVYPDLITAVQNINACWRKIRINLKAGKRRTHNGNHVVGENQSELLQHSRGRWVAVRRSFSALPLAL